MRKLPWCLFATTLVSCLCLLLACDTQPVTGMSIMGDQAGNPGGGDATEDGAAQGDDLSGQSDHVRADGLQTDEAGFLPTTCMSDDDCGDGLYCTQDSCVPGTGCTHTPIEGACDDGIDCTDDACWPGTGCMHSENLEACDDGFACTVDACSLDVGCSHALDDAICDDDNSCTDDVCTEAGCVNAPTGATCDDGDSCTTGDNCGSGTCSGEPIWGTGCIYDSSPNIGACQEGALTKAHKMIALEELNYVRSLHGLPPVVYDDGSQDQVQKCALVLAANAALNHTPPNDWSCWTQPGYTGCSKSNIHIHKYSSAQEPKPPLEPIVSLLKDENVESLGHRRWILDPFLKQVSFGAVHGQTQAVQQWPYIYTAALMVVYDQKANISGKEIEYVAYPQGDYPAQHFVHNWYLSFAAVVDDQSFWNNQNVDYSQASIQIKAPGGNIKSAYDIKWNNEGYGLPNHLQWKVVGLSNNIEYSVSISNVKWGSKSLNYSYKFTLK